MHQARLLARLAIIGELRRAAKLIRGDADAYEDLITSLLSAWEEIDEYTSDMGSPLPEEEDDA